VKLLVINTNRFDRNGISITIMNILRQFWKDDIIADVVASTIISPEFKKEIEENASLYFFQSRNRNPIKYILSLKKVIKTGKYDLIYIHGNSGTIVSEILAAMPFKKKLGLKICIHAHGSETSHPIIHKLFRKFAVSQSSCNLAASNLAGDFLFHERPFQVIPNGINPNELAFDEQVRRQYRTNLGLNDDSKFVVQLGAFTPVKNYAFSLDVIEKVSQKDSKVRFGFYGSGRLESKIEETIVAKKLQDVVSLQGVSSDVSAVFSAADLVIFPSISETFGLVALEAQAAGVPVLVSEAFTEELSLTPLIQYLELNVDSWTRAIVSSDRNDFHESAKYGKLIQTAGYDIHDRVRYLEKILLQIN